jgi:hypothetical protein
MSASLYTPGFGSTIAYAPITSGTVGTYVPIAQSIDISSPMPEVGSIKVTNNSSPSNSHEYGPGLVEPGALEWDVVYVKTTFETIYAFLGNGLIYSFQETFPDGATCTVTGFWQKLGIEGKTEDDAIKGKMAIKCCTKAIWA